MDISEKEFHQCYFCGTYVDENSLETNGKRHYLSDCRPDLVEHEIGETCTWWFRKDDMIDAFGKLIPGIPIEQTCYAYQEDSNAIDGSKWTDEHTHFYPDGPM